jgi:SAM-dependent methyltransferase
MPFHDRCADLVCFAQSWHWVDEDRRSGEAARVLRPGGRWAGWWSHARAEGEAWFDAYWGAIEAATAGRRAHRDTDCRAHRDTDWGEGLRQSGLFKVSERMTFPWVREVTVEGWLTDETSTSYISVLPDPDRHALLASIERLVRDRFPDGYMHVPYETWLWVATKVV